MASNNDIYFLSATASNKPKSNKLGDFLAKNANTDLDLSIKKEKVYEVIYSFNIFISIFINFIHNSLKILLPLAKRLANCHRPRCHLTRILNIRLLTTNNSNNYSSQLLSHLLSQLSSQLWQPTFINRLKAQFKPLHPSQKM